jgi:hypothetical protein
MIAAGLQHLTLDTGHTRVSFPDEIDPAILARLRPLTVTGEHSLTGIGSAAADGCLIRVTVDGGAALVTVFRVIPDDPPLAPLVSLAVAADEEGAGKVWPLILASAAVPSAVPPQPGAVPWLAVRLEPGLVLYPDDAGWLGDFERCWAWTWLGTRETDEEQQP